MLFRKARKSWITGSMVSGRLLAGICGIMFLFTACQKEKTELVFIAEEEKDNTGTEYILSDEKEIPEEENVMMATDMDWSYAEEDCLDKMMLIQACYLKSDSKEVNSYVSDEVIQDMMEILQESGCPVSANRPYINMYHYEMMDQFLISCEHNQEDRIVLYELHTAGGIGRKEFVFDGTNMYVLDVVSTWNSQKEPVIASTAFHRVKEWEYTQKGWFSFEYCVKEPPEVMEVIIGEMLIRVLPQPDMYNEIGKKYLYPIGYQGNNVFISSWDSSSLDRIDYTGVFEYLYEMEYGKRIWSDSCLAGIEAETFENLMIKYFPVTRQELRSYCSFDAAAQKYRWQDLGCGNYNPDFLGTAVPEINKVWENADGTVTFLIDAVCEMMGDDQVIQHELTVEFPETGGIRYLKNQVYEEDVQRIQPYQFRISDS